MEVRAVAKWLRLSPRKARLVAELIRGRSAEDALAVLANAENDPRNQMTLENLYVKDVRADEGPRRKAIWMRGRGRRDIKVHRMTHITVIVDEREVARPRTAARRRTATAPRAPRQRPAAPAPQPAAAPAETAEKEETS